MTSRHLTPVLSCLSLGLCLLSISPAGEAADNFTAVTGEDQPAKTQKRKTPKPSVNPSTGESKAERDKRLLRECRGKSNAGACEGFAS